MLKQLDNKFDYRWYVIHTHSKQEDRVSQNLKFWKIDTFSPKVKERRENEFTGKPTYISKPLFPRYIFARFSIDRLHDIQFTRGVHSVVSFGDGPIPVDDQVILLIESKIGDDGYVRVGEPIKTGDRVVIKEGPLKDFSGVFEKELKETERVMVLLSYVNYQCHIVVSKKHLQRAGHL